MEGLTTRANVIDRCLAADTDEEAVIILAGVVHEPDNFLDFNRCCLHSHEQPNIEID